MIAGNVPTGIQGAEITDEALDAMKGKEAPLAMMGVEIGKARVVNAWRDKETTEVWLSFTMEAKVG